MPFTKNNDVRIFYKTIGSGPPLLLMHGTTGCGQDWIDFRYVDELSLHYQCILLDARGHGRSDKPLLAEDYSLVSHVNDIIAVLDELAISRCHYAGYSRGGWIGYGFVHYFPERCQSLILGGAQPYSNGELVNTIGEHLRLSMPAFIEYMEQQFGRMPVEHRQRLLRADHEALHACVSLPRKDISSYLPKISQPCLIYCGDKDPIYP
jgi:pimeloyl-ACP methyl ester carboxylesterase